eukprot:TRINITY_DN7443_c0_g2_i1.p1 TRINITY_DN7443_c0_g2~~TRINITY_DN7443_c0_g2_i1.p1  ORF type:complete len:1719 (+),score=336.34 TRINITY_DN7443_c0_g2_i1:152-5308(+)
MDDAPLEERVAYLASLLDCDIAIARRSLTLTGGNVESAVQVVFAELAGEGAAPGGSHSSGGGNAQGGFGGGGAGSSSSRSAWVDVAPIDIDLDEDMDDAISAALFEAPDAAPASSQMQTDSGAAAAASGTSGSGAVLTGSAPAGSMAAGSIAGDSMAASSMPGNSMAASSMAGESMAASSAAGGSMAAGSAAAGSAAASSMAAGSMAVDSMAVDGMAAGGMAAGGMAAASSPQQQSRSQDAVAPSPSGGGPEAEGRMAEASPSTPRRKRPRLGLGGSPLPSSPAAGNLAFAANSPVHQPGRRLSMLERLKERLLGPSAPDRGGDASQAARPDAPAASRDEAAGAAAASSSSTAPKRAAREASSGEAKVPDNNRMVKVDNGGGAVGSSLVGVYVMSPGYENHGRPIFARIRQDACLPTYYLYYWDARDGRQHMGWYIGSDISSTSTPSAFCPKDGVWPPMNGWRVPYQGGERALFSVKVSKPGEVWEYAEAGTWTQLQDRTLCSQNYIRDKLRKANPPALTLNGCKTDDLPKESDGACRTGKMTNPTPIVHKIESTYFVRTSFLEGEFRDMLAQARHPPSSIECAFAIRNAFPEDLEGPIPARPFALLDNKEDAPASQPPHFKEDTYLRPEQLRSLAWMLSREQRAPEREEEDENENNFVAEWRRVSDHLSVLHGGSSEIRVGSRVTKKITKASSSSNPVYIVLQIIGSKRKFCEVRDEDFDRNGIYGFDVHYPMDGLELAEGCVIDLRIRARYSVCGGILCDKIGYGKTATTIGLIDQTARQPVPEVPSEDRSRFIPAKGTLIIVPSNLYGQWLTEIAKFVWEGNNLRGNMKKGWSPKGCPLKILAMSDVRALTSASAPEVADADIVICTYRLLYSEIYNGRRRVLCQGGLTNLMAATKKLIDGTADVLRGRKGPEKTNTWSELEFPLLEMFYWRRVVYDEFHELESFESEQQNILQHLRAHCRWGLTGTPPVHSSAGVIFMSSLFRVELPGYIKKDANVTFVDAFAAWEKDRLLAETAGRFLDRCARQNTAELPDIPLEEHVELVRHAPAERALYLGQAHDAPDIDSEDAFSTQENVQALERLLKLCTHFQAVGGHVGDAQTECKRIGEQKEKRVVKARNRLMHTSQIIRLLEIKVQQDPSSPRDLTGSAWRSELQRMSDKMTAEGDAKSVPALAVQALRQAMQSASVISWATILDELGGLKARGPELISVVGEPVPRHGNTREQWYTLWQAKFDRAKLHSILVEQAKLQGENLEEMKLAMNSLDFFQRTVAALEANHDEARNCSVCLDEGLPLTRLAITPCAHTFCIDCLRSTVATYKRCSICNQPLTLKDIQPVSAEMERPVVRLDSFADSATSSATGSSSSSSAMPAAASAPAVPAGDERYKAYGTKLAAVVKKLIELRREDPTAKVILFAQFDDLKRKVAEALTEFGIKNAMLQGSAAHRAKVIQDWQTNLGSSTYVLLLSLEQSASGANLTAAGHVVFLHPMLAPTAERAVAYELQAIGRARRQGQRKNVVHVWRFVTAETLEQSLTQRHQAGLWAAAAAAPALTADSAASLAVAGVAASCPDGAERRPAAHASSKLATFCKTSRRRSSLSRWTAAIAARCSAPRAANSSSKLATREEALANEACNVPTPPPAAAAASSWLHRPLAAVASAVAFESWASRLSARARSAANSFAAVCEAARSRSSSLSKEVREDSERCNSSRSSRTKRSFSRS